MSPETTCPRQHINIEMVNAASSITSAVSNMSSQVISSNENVMGWKFIESLDMKSISDYIINSIAPHVPQYLQDCFREACSMSLFRLSKNSQDSTVWKLFLLTPDFYFNPLIVVGSQMKENLRADLGNSDNKDLKSFTIHLHPINVYQREI